MFVLLLLFSSARCSRFLFLVSFQCQGSLPTRVPHAPDMRLLFRGHASGPGTGTRAKKRGGVPSCGAQSWVSSGLLRDGQVEFKRCGLLWHTWIALAGTPQPQSRPCRGLGTAAPPMLGSSAKWRTPFKSVSGGGSSARAPARWKEQTLSLAPVRGAQLK